MNETLSRAFKNRSLGGTLQFLGDDISAIMDELRQSKQSSIDGYQQAHIYRFISDIRSYVQ